jgi:hypothetical protein
MISNWRLPIGYNHRLSIRIIIITETRWSGRKQVTDIAHRISMLKWQWTGHWARLAKRSIGRPQAVTTAVVEWRFTQDGWWELDASSRRSSEMASNWRRLCPAVGCSGLMMMMKIDWVFNRPTKRGKEKSPSDECCQCERQMDVHLLACQQFW